MDNTSIGILIGVVLAVFGVIALSSKEKKVMKMNKFIPGIVLVVVGGVIILGTLNVIPIFGSSTGSGVNINLGGSSSNNNVPSGTSFYAPSVSFSAKDAASSTIIGTGSGYYAINSDPATTNVPTTANKGDSITFWYDNRSYFVESKTATVNAGSNPFVTNAYNNGSFTATGINSVNLKSLDNTGTLNFTITNLGTGNMDLKLSPTATKRAIPFGGVLVVEYNSTIGTVTCSNANGLVSDGAGEFHVTYTASSTAHVSKLFKLGAGLDTGNGVVGTISCQFQNVPTMAGDTIVYTIIPANYYVADSGKITLDTETAGTLASTTTRTARGMGGISGGTFTVKLGAGQ